MRSYLIDFFKSYEYCECDTEKLLTLYDKIEANAEAQNVWCAAIGKYENDAVEDYEADILAPARRAAELVEMHPWSAELLIFICMTRHLEELYKKRGIDMQIYKDTVSDLKWKMDECKAVKGVCGSFVAMWFVGFFNLKRFTLGRLQFEMIKIRYDYEKNGIKFVKDETPVINVHIPRTGTPLDKESCDRAYEMAKEMFRAEAGENPAFVCSSWLLFPKNEEILPKTTNTYRFMKEFDIIASGYDNGNNLWRLFDTDEVNPERLPADTTFRRCYRDYLLSGKRLGWGYGVKM